MQKWVPEVRGRNWGGGREHICVPYPSSHSLSPVACFHLLISPHALDLSLLGSRCNAPLYNL